MSARTSSPTSAPAPRLRSCVVCRSRKVRCDKRSPCSNCRRANIVCVLPSTDRPPRWARRLEHLPANAATSSGVASQDTAPGVGKLIDRLRTLEGLVKELSGQLEQAHAQSAASTAGDGSSGIGSPGSSIQDRDADSRRDISPATNASSVQEQFGRLVVQDASRSRYVSSGFWSRVNDELDGLKMDTRELAGEESDSSEDEAWSGRTPSTRELERTPSDRHAFLFRHNLSPSSPDLREFHPLPSQIPFLLDVFSENVNFLLQTVHMPTIKKMVRELRGNNMSRLSPPNEALMFSIYYAAITSMEDDDVMTNFGSSKTDLNLKYRLGLEHALARADFLNSPDLVLVQALAIFLGLVRRHDSPRFVWMMTGLVIRMSQYLGLQRDGANFKHLTPYEIEMRRRVWSTVCMLDLRASEDQGTDLTITNSSFDTKMPLNINDSDIDPESTDMPTERDGLTDMSRARIYLGTGTLMRQIMASSIKDGTAGLQEQSNLLDEMYRKFEEGFIPYSKEAGDITYWVGIIVSRLVVAKMTLIIFLPVLFSSANGHVSDEIRNKLLVSAIELAEYNHTLNDEQAYRNLRWLFQTYTHWHSIVYLLIEASRRPWSPIVERAWVALHSSWLIPAQKTVDKSLRMWVPLRKLMEKVRKHRNAELSRLRADPQAAARLEMEDRRIPTPSSSGPFSTGSSVDIFRERWRQLVKLQGGSGDSTQRYESANASLNGPSPYTHFNSQPDAASISIHDSGNSSSRMAFESTYGADQQQVNNAFGASHLGDLGAGTSKSSSASAPGQSVGSSYPSSLAAPGDWSDDRNMGLGPEPWLWAETGPSIDFMSSLNANSADIDMGLDGEVNWYNWIESANGMQWDTDPSSGGQT